MLAAMPVRVTTVGWLDECVLLTYRTPADSVRGLVPAGLDLVTREAGGRLWAFWNIVVSRVEGMRPAGAPKRLGVNYCHVGYRLNITARLADGEVLKGLYFARSDASRRLVGWASNRTSDFKFRSARIRVEADAVKVEARVRSRDRMGDAELTVDLKTKPASLPGSIFGSLKEAAQFLKYEPMGVAMDKNGKRVRLAEPERDEAAWQERLVHVASARWEYLDRLGQHDIALELATRVSPTEYGWKLGRTEMLER